MFDFKPVKAKRKTDDVLIDTSIISTLHYDRHMADFVT